MTRRGQKPTGYSNHPYYGYFKNMINRGREFGCDFVFGKEELDRWFSIIGYPPEGMTCPSVGRYDHSKGYVWDQENNRWNFRWEEMSENLSEMANNRGGLKFLSLEQQADLGRRSIRKQLGSGTHVSQTGKAGFYKITREQHSESSKAQARKGTHPFQKRATCEHCGFSGYSIPMRRWHFYNCKRNLQKAQLHEVYIDPSYM